LTTAVAIKQTLPLASFAPYAFCPSISKHDSSYTIQDYAQAHEASLRELYKQLFGEELEHATPTHDTLNRALQLIPHQVFKQAYQDWISALLRWEDETRQICIDGKTMRGVKKLSPNTESHIASAYNPHLQPVLSVDAVPIKCNELESIRRLLDELDVYLGEDGWSKRAGEAAKNMELLTKIDLFILQRLKAKLDKSIQRVQMLLAKLTPMQLFDLEL
jgi:transposase in ISPg2